MSISDFARDYFQNSHSFEDILCDAAYLFDMPPHTWYEDTLYNVKLKNLWSDGKGQSSPEWTKCVHLEKGKLQGIISRFYKKNNEMMKWSSKRRALINLHN